MKNEPQSFSPSLGHVEVAKLRNGAIPRVTPQMFRSSVELEVCPQGNGSAKKNKQNIQESLNARYMSSTFEWEYRTILREYGVYSMTPKMPYIFDEVDGVMQIDSFNSPRHKKTFADFMSR